jgi:hypothetical protein
MPRKYRTKTSVVKILLFSVFVMLTAFLGIWCSLAREENGFVLMTFAGMVLLVLAFWYLCEYFQFSFGKSRYMTGAERRRMRHQRKNKAGGKKILGRKIPEQHER